MSEPSDDVVRKTLRGLVLGVTALCSLAIIIGFLPGRELYVHGVLVDHEAAGGVVFAGFACWLMAPGLVVWLHPRVGFAVLWSVLAWLGSLMALAVTSVGTDVPEPDFLYAYRALDLWPTEAVHWLIGVALIAILYAVPVGAVLYGIERVREAAKAQLAAVPPVARIYRERIRRPRA
jgi:hypothetical protein